MFDVEATIVLWGAAVKVKFDLDNLHLTAKASHGALAVFIQATKANTPPKYETHGATPPPHSNKRWVGWPKLKKLWMRAAAAAEQGGGGVERNSEDPSEDPTNTGPTNTENVKNTMRINASVGGGAREGVGGCGNEGGGGNKMMGLSGEDEKMETLAGKFAPDFFLRI